MWFFQGVSVVSVVCRLAITSVRVPTDTPDTCWNKLLFIPGIEGQNNLYTYDKGLAPIAIKASTDCD